MIRIDSIEVEEFRGIKTLKIRSEAGILAFAALMELVKAASWMQLNLG
jgi:hypothetical protein